MSETIESIIVNGATYWLPADENDVITLVNRAKAEKKTICMRGAAHSFPIINTLEAQAASGKNIYIMLSKMNKVTIDKPNMMVTVDAGCHLGEDPFDPTKKATLQDSLLWQLDQQGMAVGDLGGITHQTIGGFMSTGSSGGSTQFAFEEGLVSVDIIICGSNGAEKVTYRKPVPDNPDDPFYAVGYASMGLMGVIISATYKCIPKFNITGSETISTCDDCEIDLFDSGKGDKLSFQKFLEQTQYSRIIWWPQEHVTKAVVWKATRMDAGAPFVRQQYKEVPWIAGSPVLAEVGADVIYTAMARWPDWLDDLIGTNTKEYGFIKPAVEAAFKPIIFPAICQLFVKPGVQTFQDYWYTGLPMDNQMSDKIMPVWFTELWIPIEQSENVMNELKTFYAGEKCIERTGIFCVEIYAAKQSPFWMSPAYETDVIRIDIFWFANAKGDPAAYYQQFWDLLQKYKFRPHWGKYLPDGKSAQGVGYLRSLYPKWNAWMKLRDTLDPNKVFVSDYWENHLGISDWQNPTSVSVTEKSSASSEKENGSLEGVWKKFKKLFSKK